MGAQEVEFQEVPRNALLAFTRAAVLRDAEITDVINWCIQVLGAVGQNSSIVWVEGENSSITKIDITPIPPGDPGVLSVMLSAKTRRAMAQVSQRFSCDKTGVLTRAAWLAVYFERTGGRLASAFVRKGRFTSRSGIRYLT